MPTLNRAAVILLAYCSSYSIANEEFYDLDLHELMNIKITASSQFSESELTSSSSVSVINRSNWQDRGDRTTFDAIGHTTNAMILPTAIGAAIQMRGYAGTLSGRGSASLVDDVPTNSLQYGTSVYSMNNLQLGLLDRIEVVRGPGSAMYGSDAFHSTIAYHTYTSNKAEATVSAESGQQGFYQGSIRASHPINDDWVINTALSASGQSTQERDQYYTDPVAGRLKRNYPYKMQDSGFLFKLHNGTSSSPWQITLTGLYNSEDHPSLNGFGSREDQGDKVLGSLDLSGQTTDSSLYKVDLKRQLNEDISLKLSSYYRESHGGFYLNTIDNNSLRVITNDYALDENRYGNHFNVTQQLPSWNSEWSITLGQSSHEVTQFELSSSDTLTATPTSSNIDLRSDEFSKQTVNDLAFEAKTRILDDQLIFTYGARVDKYPEFGSQTSPRFSAVYLLNPHSALKFIYGNAFRAPVIGEKSGLGHVEGCPTLKPEEIDSYEWVYMVQGKQWKTELVYYENEFKKGIAIYPKALPTPEYDRIYVNFSEQASRGIEASFHYLAKHWTFAANLALVDSKNITANNETHTAYPKQQANIDIGYRLTANTKLHISTQYFNGHLLGDKITANNTDVGKAGHYLRSDIHLEHTLNPHWSAWLNIKNIVDKDNRFPSIMNGEGGIPDIERTVSIGSNYHF